MTERDGWRPGDEEEISRRRWGRSQRGGESRSATNRPAKVQRSRPLSHSDSESVSESVNERVNVKLSNWVTDLVSECMSQ